MKYSPGDECYIIENNIRVTSAKVLKCQGKFCVIQISGSKGAIRLPEGRLYRSEDEALAAIKRPTSTHQSIPENNNGYIDVFEGHRNNRSPHL